MLGAERGMEMRNRVLTTLDPEDRPASSSEVSRFRMPEETVT